MPLKIRYSPIEGVMRSIGDPPNGIVSIQALERSDWVIDPAMPPAAMPGVTVHDTTDRPDLRSHLVVITPDELAAAVLPDKRTTRKVVATLGMSIAQNAAHVHEHPLCAALTFSLTELLRETMDALDSALTS